MVWSLAHGYGTATQGEPSSRSSIALRLASNEKSTRRSHASSKPSRVIGESHSAMHRVRRDRNAPARLQTAAPRAFRLHVANARPDADTQRLVTRIRSWFRNATRRHGSHFAGWPRTDGGQRPARSFNMVHPPSAASHSGATPFDLTDRGSGCRRRPPFSQIARSAPSTCQQEARRA